VGQYAPSDKGLTGTTTTPTNERDIKRCQNV
jgi:hypothetical protein